MQNCVNVLNEDTDVAGEQGWHLHSCGWQCKRTIEDQVRGQLRVQDASQIVTHTPSKAQLLRQWEEDCSCILILVVLTNMPQHAGTPTPSVT